MSISKLYYFSKNTDATASIRGYKYQELKALESWIQNKVNGNDEILYCDYEDDIFHRDINQYKSKFRQIKLYTSNFSFSSEEIKKALFHFFMLYSKGDYIMDEISFIFETNSKVAQRYDGNNADILKNWSLNQDNLTDELIFEVIPIVKCLLDFKIESLVSDNTIEQSIRDHYYNIPEETWKDFVKRIKWEFSNISPLEEMDRLNESIIDLLRNIDSPIEKDDVEIIYATLLKQVSQASASEEPINRGLTISKFDEVILNLGNSHDKWYLKNFIDWKDADISEVENFHPGWFFELLQSAEFCRRYSYADEHSVIWINHLQNQLNTNDIPERFARRGYYELVYSKIKPHLIPQTKNDITEYLDGINFYFDSIHNHLNIYDIEKAKNLLMLVFSVWKRGFLKVDEEMLAKWSENYETILIQEIEKESSSSERKCILLQCLGFHKIFKNLSSSTMLDFKEAIDIFKGVVQIQKDVPSFNISELSDLLNKITGVFCEVGLDEGFEDIEEFNESISNLVKDRMGEMAFATSAAQKGVQYLKSNSIKGIIKSIDNFHKTKDIYQNADTIEGFVLSLLNISQFYSLLNLTFASKYYALCSSFVCIQNSNPDLNRKIADSLSFSLLSDYKQGSWFSFLLSFQEYLSCLRSFNFQEFEYIEQKNTKLILSNFTIICTALPEISSEYEGLAEYYLQTAEQIFGMPFSQLKAKANDLLKNEGLDSFMKTTISGNLINDSGPIRKITFLVFDIKWNIICVNNYIMNSIAEEFISILQIWLGEILLSKYDFHLFKAELELNLNFSSHEQKPNRKPNNQTIQWDIYLPEFSSHDPKAVNNHYARIGDVLFSVLSEISLLPKDEFVSLTKKLFKEQNLATKTLSVNSYQFIYRCLLSKDEFNNQNRQNFAQNEVFVSDISKIPMDKRISVKYDQFNALDKISQRYINCQNILSKSLPIYLESATFKKNVINLRETGYLDWEILHAITTKVVSLKVNMIIKRESNENEDQFVSRVVTKHVELMSQESEEDRIFVPEQYIFDEQHNLQFGINTVGHLQSFGLQSRAITPVFNGIRYLLIQKFNYNKDDVKELSPFKF